MARPIFVLSSGRSGTFQVASLLRLNPDLEVHHEYEFGQTLMNGVRSHMIGRFREDLEKSLQDSHGAAVRSSAKALWVDVSNALPWALPVLVDQFPEGRFILLVRNGRRVVSSFFHKFQDVMYPSQVVKAIEDWMKSGGHRPGPLSPELWRPLPQPHNQTEIDISNRFQLLSWYWSHVNDYSHRVLTDSSVDFHVYRFEEILRKKQTLQSFLELMDTELSEQHLKELFVPTNVAIPETFPLSREQERDFWHISGQTMELFGYGEKDDYRVAY